MTRPYDSTDDTMTHINAVRRHLDRCVENLRDRAQWHDASKLEAPEKAAFDELTPRLAGLTYGSDEYRESLRALKPALDHHYAQNSHHPEHYPDGVAGMSLFDVVEMAAADWVAATQRHDDGDLLASLAINRERFGLSDQLVAIIRNTWVELGLISASTEEAP